MDVRAGTGRIIGIRHRTKQTAEGEAKPTQVFVLNDPEGITYDLSTETDELDWLLGRFPIGHRKIQPDDSLGDHLTRHVKWVRTKDPDQVLSQHLRSDETGTWQATHVPVAFDGLRSGDRISMVLGGSGDAFAFALSRRGEEVEAQVFRIPPFQILKHRSQDKEHDAENLARLLLTNPELFYRVLQRDRDLILVREALRARVDAMKARIACEQRLRSRTIGSIFCSEEGRYPEGFIEDIFDEQKANDRILVALATEERRRNADLERACEDLGLYQAVFSRIEGMGPAIAARLISAIQDIRRFPTSAKFKAFCGVHVLSGGRHADVPMSKQFPRRRGGAVANWNPDARQALFLFGEQCNRRPASEWGQKLLWYKEHFRRVHPEEIVAPVSNGDGTERAVRRYTNGHILKMAKWRTVTKFAEWLWRAWWMYEEQQQRGNAEGKVA